MGSAVNTKLAGLTSNGTNSFTDVRIFGSVLKKMAENYSDLSGDADYVGAADDSDIKRLYPVMNEIEGAAATTTFTPTVSEGWTIDELAGKYAIMYNKTAFDALSDDEKDCVNYALDIQVIVSNTATDFTVGTNITSGYDAVYILDSDYHVIEGVKSRDTSKTNGTIDATSSDNNGTSVVVAGNNDNTVTMTANFALDAAVQYGLEIASQYGCPIQIRAGKERGVGQLMTTGSFVINDFSDSSATDGTGLTTVSFGVQPSANIDTRKQVAADQEYMGLQKTVGCN
jgi:hypothetical protein